MRDQLMWSFVSSDLDLLIQDPTGTAEQKVQTTSNRYLYLKDQALGCAYSAWSFWLVVQQCSRGRRALRLDFRQVTSAYDTNLLPGRIL
jgi:hypothetical protein